jgi:hypothetical protein
MRPNTRRYRRLASRLAKASLTMSRRQIAKRFGITTPGGEPNGRMVKWLIDGYVPAHEDTLRRCGLLTPPKPRAIPEEPTRRVLTGPWYLHGRLVGPEEYFGGRS